MEQNKNYGKVTVGFGTSQQREIAIEDFVQARYKDNRFISVSSLEDGSLVATVENLESSERNTQQSIWLTKESFIGMISTAILYFNMKGEDLNDLFKNAIEKEEIDIKYSDNLKKL